jgi:NADPH:quinone reductase-like Zn-dependent oxidoreductase/quercetin dioxygenase-like cupin family protein
VPVPTPAAGQVLVHVRAAGVNAMDWKIREGYLRDAIPLTLPATLGLELAGEVVGAGDGVSRFTPGDRVMGLVGGLGAYADYVAVDAALLVRTPDALTDVEAAALPVAVLTAAQALDAGGLRAGQTVLIHGAAGAVGGFSVQLAKARGATVVATASATSRAHVLALGADTVIDYRAETFEEHVHAADLVLDFAGGDVPARSWTVLAAGGALVSTVVPDVAAHAPEGRRGEFLMMRPDADALASLTEAVARGELRSTIAETVAPAGLSAAIERTRTGHAPGKLVLDLDTGFAAAADADAAAPVYPPIPPDDPRRSLAIARPETDDTLPHVGIGTGTYTILLTGRDTAGRYSLIDMLVPPGGGPPPHRHDFEEMFTVLEGEVAMTFRGETMVVRRGETINVPANAPHAFRNASDAPARLLCMCTPAGQEDMFLEIGVPVATRTTAPPPPDPATRAAGLAKALALAPKYRSEFLLP